MLFRNLSYSLFTVLLSFSLPVMADLKLRNGSDIDMTGSSGSTIIFPDGSSLGSSPSSFTTTLLVNGDGTATDNGTALLATMSGISGNSSTNPYLIKLEPGIYDLSGVSLLCKSYVDIEGSGEGVTTITSSKNWFDGTIITGVGDTVEIRSLTIENTSAGSVSTCIYPYTGAYLSLKSVTLLSTSAASQKNSVYNPYAYLTLRDCTIKISGATAVAYGIHSETSSATHDIANSVVSVSSSGTAYGFRFGNSSDPTATVRDCTISGTGTTNSWAIESRTGATVTVSDSTLTTGDTGGSSFAWAVATSDSTTQLSIRNCRLLAEGTGSSSYAIHASGSATVRIATSELYGETGIHGTPPTARVNCFDENYVALADIDPTP